LSIPLRCNFENTCLCFDELPFGVWDELPLN
jgi:hypothetical protein